MTPYIDPVRTHHTVPDAEVYSKIALGNVRRGYYQPEGSPCLPSDPNSDDVSRGSKHRSL